MNAFSSLAQAKVESWPEVKAKLDAAVATEQSFTKAYINAVVKTPDRSPKRTAEIERVPAWVWDEDERLTNIRCDLEYRMVTIPAPDLANAVFKLVDKV